MPSITRKVFIKAGPEEVFDLVARIEDFPLYSTYIKDIKKVSPGVYHWRVELLKVPMEWEARVIESERPVRLAWESFSGVLNRGSYDMKPVTGGVQVTFKMEFHLESDLLAIFTAPVLDLVTSKVAGELLENIKKRLEV
ncbi:MAG: SRPBCC family protein [Thermodesulfobacteriota bacterium]